MRHDGTIKWRGQHLFLSEILTGEPVGLSLIGEDTWLVRYGSLPKVAIEPGKEEME